MEGQVEDTGQKNTVLTLYELTRGEGVRSQGITDRRFIHWRELIPSKDFYGMDPELLQKALNVLVKRGKAQIFGGEDQQGVKFF